MGENHAYGVVLRIQPKFWWMLPMGVRDNHTKYAQQTQWWQPEMGAAHAGPPFQNLQFRAKITLSLPKTALEPAKGQMKGTSGNSTHATRLPRVAGPSRAPQLHNMSANRPQKALKRPKLCAHWPLKSPNQNRN